MSNKPFLQDCITLSTCIVLKWEARWQQSPRCAQTHVAFIIFQYNKNGSYLTLGLPNNILYNLVPTLQMRHYSCFMKTRCTPCQQSSISHTVCQFGTSVCTSRWSINLWLVRFCFSSGNKWKLLVGSSPNIMTPSVSSVVTELFIIYFLTDPLLMKHLVYFPYLSGWGFL